MHYSIRSVSNICTPPLGSSLLIRPFFCCFKHRSNKEVASCSSAPLPKPGCFVICSAALQLHLPGPSREDGPCSQTGDAGCWEVSYSPGWKSELVYFKTICLVGCTYTHPRWRQDNQTDIVPVSFPLSLMQFSYTVVHPYIF